MSKANTGKGKGVETQPKGGDTQQGKKNAKMADRTADNAGAQRGGRGGAAAAGAGKGGQQQQQGQQRPGGKGGAGPNDQKGAAPAKVPDYLANYPRLNLDSENKKLDDYTKQIDAAYEQMDEIRKRIEVIQEERKAIQTKELESRDARSEQSLVRDKLVSERNALRKKIEQLVGARKRKLEELNRMKRQLPINKDIKDSAKVVALNLEFLDKEERIVEQKIKSAVSALQDRSSSKELSGLTAKRRQVKEWAKFAQEAEAPVDPTLDARLKELDEEIKKLNEGDREVKGDYMRLKEALQAKGDELGAAKLERSAIAQKIETLKKDRDAVYAVIRDKRKEHNNKVRDLQRADREKKAQLDKERRIKQKKEQRAKALQELAQAYKEELAMCDRLSALLVNRQAKQQQKKASGEEAHEEAAPEQQEEEQEEEQKKEEEDEEEEHTNGDDEEEASTTATGTRRTRFQFTNATHIDFEFLSVQPPTSLEEIPAALDSIARKKAFYERLAAEKEEERKRIEAQYDAELQAMETGSGLKKAPAAKKATENGTGAAKRPAAKKANNKDDAAAAATKEEGEEEQANADEAESPAESNGDADAPAADEEEAEATEDGDE